VKLVLGRFEDGEALLEAARRLREAGHRGLDLYSPYPLEGAAEALGLRRSSVPRAILVAGLSGALGGYLIQWFCNAYDFPINVNGRPPHSAPSFVPITFESGVLAASFGAVLALLWLFRFPMPWHPVQQAEPFRSATVDGYWLSVPVQEEGPEAIAREIEALGAKAVSVVGPEEEA